MRFRFACCVALLGAAAELFAAPVPKSAEPPPVYYPLGVEARWVYARDGLEDERFTVSAVERDKSNAVVSIKCLNIPWTASVYPKTVVSAEGLRQESGWILKTGLASGSSWKGPGDITRTVYGPEEVETRAGKFKALRVEWLENDVTHTVWYAPNIGEVKYVTKSCGETRLQRSLRSFHPSERKAPPSEGVPPSKPK